MKSQYVPVFGNLVLAMPGMHMWQIPGSQWMWTDFYVSCDAHLLWPLCHYTQWVLMGLICPAWDRRWSKYSVQQISYGFIFGPLTKIPNAKHCKRVWKIISLHIFAHEFAAWFRLFQIHPGSWFEIVWSNKKPWKVQKGSSYHLHMCAAFAEGSTEAGRHHTTNASPGPEGKSLTDSDHFWPLWECLGTVRFFGLFKT